MNNVIKSLTILLHAVVITAVLSSLTLSERNSKATLPQESANFFYPLKTIVTTHL